MKNIPAAAVTVFLLFCFSCSRVRSQDGEVRDEPRFTDDGGRDVFFSAPFTRIASLYGAHTENLFSVGAGESVIAAQTGAVWPDEAGNLPRVNYTGDPEYLISLSPDLVLIRPFIRRQHPAYIAEIEKAGITVVSLFPETLDEFDEYIVRLGMLAGREAEAREKLEDFHRGLAALRARASGVERKKTVFFEATENEIRTAAAGSLPARAIFFAGGINVAENAAPVTRGSSIAPFGVENLLSRAAEIDAYIVQQGAMNPVAGFAALRARPGFGSIRAVREGSVLFIDEKIISAPVFRWLDGVRVIADFLYPAGENSGPGPQAAEENIN